jgi:hypothetical protein
VGLAQTATNAADPINFSPYFSLKGVPDPWDNIVEAHALLAVNTIGDMNVPINAGIANARAAGAVPFLRPEAAAKYPALADYVTPKALYDALGGKTPNRALVDNYVLEGIARLARTPAGASCQPNEVPLTVSACHPTCSASGSANACLSDQSCVGGVCRRTMSQTSCQRTLFDPDDLDEGLALFAQQKPGVPLRLARVSANATQSTLDAVWAPRLRGVPRAGSDAGAWDAGRRITGVLDAFILPAGIHMFHLTNPCDNFDHGMYLVNLTGRFFASEGRDLYYLSHPATHRCLADSSCPGLAP